MCPDLTEMSSGFVSSRKSVSLVNKLACFLLHGSAIVADMSVYISPIIVVEYLTFLD